MDLPDSVSTAHSHSSEQEDGGKDRTDFDYLILGAGIAGLSLADALDERGFEVCVVEKNDIGAGASGTPGALVNPATGRRASKVWKAEHCYKAIADNLEKVSPYSERPFYRKNGVLRPALTEKMAGKMREQYEENDWKNGWCEWMDESELRAFHPGIECVIGGLWLPLGMTVDSAEYLRALSRYLMTRGVEIITGHSATPAEAAGHWTLSLSGRRIKAGDLVYCTGHQTISSPYWKGLPLHPIKGQIVRFSTNGQPLDFDHSISSLGYIANLGEEDTFYQGSTYEHDFEGLRPDDYGKEYLRERLEKTLPRLASEVTAEEGWAGVRVSTPNRKPVLGRHPEKENLHIFTALGSKGLMYGKYLAAQYADFLAHKGSIYKSVSIQRFDIEHG